MGKLKYKLHMIAGTWDTCRPEEADTESHCNWWHNEIWSRKSIWSYRLMYLKYYQKPKHCAGCAALFCWAPLSCKCSEPIQMNERRAVSVWHLTLEATYLALKWSVTQDSVFGWLVVIYARWLSANPERLIIKKNRFKNMWLVAHLAWDRGNMRYFILLLHWYFQSGTN